MRNLSALIGNGLTNPPRRPRPWRLAVIGFVLLQVGWSSGCSREQTPWHDYLTRVARVLDVATPEVRTDDLVAWPRRRALRFVVPAADIDVAQFIELHQCDLGALVGTRNSPLGRLRGDARELAYQRLLVAGIERCTLAGHAPGWLKTLAVERRAQFGPLYWNALFASQEWFSYASRGTGGGRPEGVVLARFESYWQGLDEGFELVNFERDLGQLAAQPGLRYARERWLRSAAMLSAVAALLEQHTTRVCLNRQPTPRSRRLANVFRKVFVAGLRPSLTDELNGSRALVETIERLAGAVGPHPAAQPWLSAMGAEWRSARAAVRRHAQAWSALFAHCGLGPEEWAASPEPG